MKKNVFVLVLLGLVCMGFMIHSGYARASSAKPINLKFAYWPPPVSTPPKMVFEPWAKKVEQRTNGRVKITFYGGEALGKAPDHYDLALRGTADISWIDPNFTPGAFPLVESIALPMEFPSSEVASAVFWELMKKYMMNTSFKKVKVLFVHTTGLFQLFSRKKQVRKLEDLKGMKLAATSPTLSKIIKALGGVPVFMPEPDIYTSLERGLLDGRWQEWEGAWVFKMPEVTKYRTANVNLATNTCMAIMNLDAWNKLPKDIQKIFDETTGLELSRFAGATFDKQCEKFLEIIKDYDKKAGKAPIYYLPDSERARWVKAISGVAGAWAKEKESKGLPANAVVKDLRDAVKRYSK